MSAQDNLSPQQFMAVSDLGKFQSMDYPDKTMDQVHQMFRRREKISIDFRNQMEYLRGNIADHGIQAPITVYTEGSGTGHPAVGDGHHRYSAAKSLRMKEVPVRDAGGRLNGQETSKGLLLERTAELRRRASSGFA